MADLRRIPIDWTTGPGGTGVSVFYSLDPADPTGALGTFFNAIKGLFPTYVTWSIPSSGDTIESTTGVLTGSWSGGTSASITGTGSGASAAGTGFYVRWYTDTIRNGRKFLGRTFFCPIAVGGYASDGTLDASNQAAMQTAVNTLVGASALVVWGRPTTPGGSDGLFAEQTSGLVPDKVTSLRTRRT